jgi:hypothetical protein
VAGEFKVHGFLATPIPEPGSLSEMLAGVCLGLVLIADPGRRGDVLLTKANAMKGDRGRTVTFSAVQ